MSEENNYERLKKIRDESVVEYNKASDDLKEGKCSLADYLYYAQKANVAERNFMTVKYLKD